MRLNPILTAAFGGGAKLLGTASSLAIIVGAVYLVDCRINSKGVEGIDRCYLSALPMMGLGAGTAGGFLAGYQTYNPALRPKDSDDTQGLFRKRQP